MEATPSCAVSETGCAEQEDTLKLQQAAQKLQ
jgi:hypothetical protein